MIGSADTKPHLTHSLSCFSLLAVFEALYGRLASTLPAQGGGQGRKFIEKAKSPPSKALKKADFSQSNLSAFPLYPPSSLSLARERE